MSSLSKTNSFTQPKVYRHGAEAARVAHNHEVTRSKRVAGIIIISHQCIMALRAQNTYRCGAEAARCKTSSSTFLTYSPF